jgi:hypothetical protein
LFPVYSIPGFHIFSSPRVLDELEKRKRVIVVPQMIPIELYLPLAAIWLAGLVFGIQSLLFKDYLNAGIIIFGCILWLGLEPIQPSWPYGRLVMLALPSAIIMCGLVRKIYFYLSLKK